MDEKSSYQSEFLGSTPGHAVSNEQMLKREVIVHTAAYSPRVVGWPVKGSMPLGQSLKKSAIAACFAAATALRSPSIFASVSLIEACILGSFGIWIKILSKYKV